MEAIAGPGLSRSLQLGNLSVTVGTIGGLDEMHLPIADGLPLL
jgi:hypothetical protein